MTEISRWLTWREVEQLRLTAAPAEITAWKRYLRQEPLSAHPRFRRECLRLGVRSRRGKPTQEYHYLILPLAAIVAFETKTREPWVYSAQTARSGTSVLETACGGLLRAYLLKSIRSEPLISATMRRRQCINLLGDPIPAGQIAHGRQRLRPMPPVRTFNHIISILRHEAENDGP